MEYRHELDDAHYDEPIPLSWGGFFVGVAVWIAVLAGGVWGLGWWQGWW